MSEIFDITPDLQLIHARLLGLIVDDFLKAGEPLDSWEQDMVAIRLKPAIVEAYQRGLNDLLKQMEKIGRQRF